MKLSEKAILKFCEENNLWSVLLRCKDENGTKHNGYISCTIGSKELLENIKGQLKDKKSNSCLVDIKEGFVGGWYNKKDKVVVPCVVIKDITIEKIYQF